MVNISPISDKLSLAIVGSGPAGVVFYDLVRKFSKKYRKEGVILLDRSGDICSALLRYNVFVENIKSKCVQELKFLVDGKKTGPDIYRYFKKKYSLPVTGFDVKKISKNKDGLFALFSENSSIVVGCVVLATGVKQKLLPEEIFDLNRGIYDLTFNKFTELQKIDFINKEIIFIGSGDNALFKSRRIAEWIDLNAIAHRPNCIKIFVKNFFKSDCNKNFYADVKKYVDKGIIQIVSNLWDIKKIQSNKNGLVSIIHSTGGDYQTDFIDGAYLSIHTGNIMEIPILANCTLKDFTLIGDLGLFAKNDICSIYGAIKNAEEVVQKFI
jgi:thioredoxin reductase